MEKPIPRQSLRKPHIALAVGLAGATRREPQLIIECEHESFGSQLRCGTHLNMYQQRIGARAEYLQEEKERIKASTSLAEKFPQLKSLSATLTYFAPNGATQHSEIKCTFNLAYAKSLFLFDCPNKECIGGNFDLSSELAQAVAQQCPTATGEIRCQGWQSKTTIGRICCDHLLRYKLSLGY